MLPTEHKAVINQTHVTCRCGLGEEVKVVRYSVVLLFSLPRRGTCGTTTDCVAPPFHFAASQTERWKRR